MGYRPLSALPAVQHWMPAMLLRSRPRITTTKKLLGNIRNAADEEFACAGGGGS
jgi:hypothetical protein